MASSRIETARRRLRVARYSIGATAAILFGLIGFAVRDSHPATRSAPVTQPTQAAFEQGGEYDDEDDGAFAYGGGASIAPAAPSIAPAIASGGS